MLSFNYQNNQRTFDGKRIIFFRIKFSKKSEKNLQGMKKYWVKKVGEQFRRSVSGPFPGIEDGRHWTKVFGTSQMLNQDDYTRCRGEAKIRQIRVTSPADSSKFVYFFILRKAKNWLSLTLETTVVKSLKETPRCSKLRIGIKFL